MPSENNSLTTFFQHYEQARNSSDTQTMLSQFAESFTVVTKQDTQIVRASDFALFLPKRKGLFHQLGSSGASLESLETTPLGNHAALAQTSWKMQFARPEGPSQEFIVHSSFILSLHNDSPKIFVYIPHQDIMEELRTRGILT